jgi:hypothetical protein
MLEESCMTKSLEEYWKKNDELLHAALKKMSIIFKRNKETWEVDVRTSHMSKRYFGMASFDENDNFVDEGPNTPESLGTIKYFVNQVKGDIISNIFFGVHNYEELKIKLDLMS